MVRKLKRIRITTLEMIFCPFQGEVIVFDSECIQCICFNGMYDAIGYIECNYDEKKN